MSGMVRYIFTLICACLSYRNTDMGDKEIGVPKKRSIFFTCIFDGTDKYAPDHEIPLAARTAF